MSICTESRIEFSVYTLILSFIWNREIIINQQLVIFVELEVAGARCPSPFDEINSGRFNHRASAPTAISPPRHRKLGLIVYIRRRKRCIWSLLRSDFSGTGVNSVSAQLLVRTRTSRGMELVSCTLVRVKPIAPDRVFFFLWRNENENNSMARFLNLSVFVSAVRFWRRTQ
jgi:hypothetical protein